MFNKKSEAKKNTQTVDAKKNAFDYQTVKAQANDLEREGRWLDAAEAWTTIARESTNQMVVKMARQKVETAKLNAREHGDAGAASRETTPAANASSDDPVSPAPPATGEVSTSEERVGDTEVTAAPVSKPTRELPPVGTVIQKRDRKGELRSECKVVEGGIEYKGTIYKSLSAAALAASKDLGLGATTLDGWAWWGLKAREATAPSSKKDLTAALERAFAKYRERAEALAKSATGDEQKKVFDVLRAHGAALVAMAVPSESDPESAAT